MQLGAYIEGIIGSEDYRAATRRNYASNLRKHLLPALGSRDVVDVTAGDLRVFFASIREDGVGPGAALLSYRLLSKAFRTALSDGLIDRNPLDGVRAPRSQRSEFDPPSAGEVDALAAAIAPQYRALVLLLAYGGLRVGEAGGLRLEDWQPERRRLRVRRQATRTGVAPLKTAAARRTIFLPGFVAAELERHVRDFRPVDGRMFSSSAGGRIYSDIFYPAFASACRRAGVRPMRPHALRHHAVSAMVRSGASLRAVQAVVGHESPRLTLAVYSHVTEDDLADVASRLSPPR